MVCLRFKLQSFGVSVNTLNLHNVYLLCSYAVFIVVLNIIATYFVYLICGAYINFINHNPTKPSYVYRLYW